ncbi:MAG: acyl-CoA dehydrogenase family protein, partial [Candidatus Hodarchaeota archaeon]
MVGKQGKVQCINDDILKKLSLKNRYKFLNLNLMSLLKPEEMKFLQKVQKFFVKFEKENNITHDEDFYEWIPAIGKEGFVTRMWPFEELGLNYEEHGMIAEFCRIIATDFFDPQLAMGMGASVLAVNPLLFHHKDVDIRLKAMKELVTGEKVGCLAITEPERGSDATHMLTTCSEQGDGSFVINGQKIFQTNGSRADWAVIYATAEKDNPNA